MSTIEDTESEGLSAVADLSDYRKRKQSSEDTSPPTEEQCDLKDRFCW